MVARVIIEGLVTIRVECGRCGTTRANVDGCGGSSGVKLRCGKAEVVIIEEFTETRKTRERGKQDEQDGPVWERKI